MSAAETSRIGGLAILCAMVLVPQTLGIASALQVRKRRLGGEYVVGWFVPLLTLVTLAALFYLAVTILYPCEGSGCGMGLVIILVSTVQLGAVNVVVGIFVQLCLWLVLRHRTLPVKGA